MMILNKTIDSSNEIFPKLQELSTVIYPSLKSGWVPTRIFRHLCLTHQKGILKDSITECEYQLEVNKEMIPVLNKINLFLPYKESRNIQYADITDLLAKVSFVPNKNKLILELDASKLMRIYEKLNKDNGTKAFYAPVSSVMLINNDESLVRYGYTVISFIIKKGKYDFAMSTENTNYFIEKGKKRAVYQDIDSFCNDLEQV